MSTINTNGLDINYPVPGQNNSSQGFRNNFQNIKNNLDVAANEITDLQTKVVVKAALNNTTLNNDMANTLISNASTRSFRATTYNLGNALSGTVLVDVSLGDVQYGTVAANTVLSFGGWAPTNTQSNVVLQLAISNANASIQWPTEVVFSNDNYGVTMLENFANVSNSATVTAPYGVSQLNYLLSSIDCGNSIYIQPLNRPYIATQLETRTPPSTGEIGDVSGTVCVSESLSQIVITNTYANDLILTANTTSQLYPDMPIVFTGNSTTLSTAGITPGTTYYVNQVVSSNTFTITSTSGGGGSNVNINASSGNVYANPISYLYIATDDYAANISTKTVSNTTVTTDTITLNNTTSLTVNSPIIFEGTAFGNLTANQVYYIKSISSPNITVSATRYNGVAGATFPLTTANNDGGNIVLTACVFDGPDIWKRIPLQPF